MSELADFVLNAFRQVGGIVEPPAYGIYEVLLPEEVARRWGTSAYQHLAFADEPPAEVAGTEDVTVLGYGHPLVDTLVEEVRARPTCLRLYVNDVRLDKRGLPELARQVLAFPNARLSGIPRRGESAALFHCVCFNFKAALITDEKREQLVTVVMDAQAGFAVPELAYIERQVRLEEESAFGHLLPAPVRWLPGRQALSRPVLEGLLERATRAALDELTAPLDTLRRRAARYLELDQARLTGYYDDIARDLQRRLERADDPGRRESLEAKLATAEAERQAKLADVEAKYSLRVELELINLQVIVQPKILLPVHIGNRTAEIERTVVWDPLLHRIEPLACDVCGRSTTRLMLCSSGHLAHEECLLATQCIDCKRIYCRKCADQMSQCIVCERPVCVCSLNRCGECGRATCREHVGLCHAADGQPARLAVAPSPEPEKEAQPLPEAAPSSPATEQEERVVPTPAPHRYREEKYGTSARVARQVRLPVTEAPRVPAPYKIEVYVEPDVPVVNGFVLTKGKKQIAVRSWELTDEGILVTCRCEKWHRCSVDGRVLVLAEGTNMEALIEAQIEALRREYGVPARQVFRYAVVRGASRQVPRTVLRGEWKAER